MRRALAASSSDTTQARYHGSAGQSSLHPSAAATDASSSPTTCTWSASRPVRVAGSSTTSEVGRTGNSLCAASASQIWNTLTPQGARSEPVDVGPVP